MRRAGLVALACAGFAVGVLAERQLTGWSDLRGWLPDLLAGWTLVGLGIALLALRRPRGAAALLLLAGFGWFAFNFGTTEPEPLQRLAVHSAYFHRGPLLALALALPAGRPRTRLAVAGVLLAWSAAVAWPAWEDDLGALGLVCIFLALAVTGYVRASGRRARSIAARGLAAVELLSLAVAADAVRSLAGASQSVTDATVLAYAVAVALAGVVLFTAALLDAPASLAERAVALERGGSTLRDALRDLLGDPGLEISFALPGAPEDGGDLLRAPAVAGRVATPVTVAGHEVGLVAHDPTALADEATRAAVLAAVGLAAERARLRTEVDRQAEAVAASRRRLLLAEDEERRRLAERLDRGPGAALAGVERLVQNARSASGADDGLTAALERAAEQLLRVAPELDALVRGLGRADAGGLVPALGQLAATAPVETTLALADVDVSPETASAIWFVCAESLANAVKHADARSVRITLAGEEGIVRLSVEDDGLGGADPAGSGLVGLADRVAALDGRLAVTSPPGGGTRVVAELPFAGPSGEPRHSTRRHVPG